MGAADKGFEAVHDAASEPDAARADRDYLGSGERISNGYDADRSGIL
ncbi:MAG: hypothetical protein ACYDEW_01070 [Vulcanimicrobiaceae bacterium]